MKNKIIVLAVSVAFSCLCIWGGELFFTILVKQLDLDTHTLARIAGIMLGTSIGTNLITGFTCSLFEKEVKELRAKTAVNDVDTTEHNNEG